MESSHSTISANIAFAKGVEGDFLGGQPLQLNGTRQPPIRWMRFAYPPYETGCVFCAPAKLVDPAKMVGFSILLSDRPVFRKLDNRLCLSG